MIEQHGQTPHRRQPEAQAALAIPLGIVELIELFEDPFVLFGREFWEPLRAFMRDRLIAEGTIDRKDYDRLIVTDSPAEAMAHIADAAVKEFGFQWRPKTRPRWVLGEKGLGEKSMLFRPIDFGRLKDWMFPE